MSKEERIPTGVEGFDSLLDGGLPCSTLVELFGLKAVGKSILGLQASCSAASMGLNALVVDTELGYAQNLLPYWKTPLSRRFDQKVTVSQVSAEKRFEDGRKKKVTEALVKDSIRSALSQLRLDPSDAQLAQAAAVLLPSVSLSSENFEKCIYFTEQPGLQELLLLHGVDSEFIVSEGGRVELRLRPGGISSPDASPIGTFIRERGIKLLVYDSISSPIKSTFTGTQDLPARSTALALLLGQAQKLASRFNLAILAVNHISVHPHNPNWTHPYGGLIMEYDFKYVFHLEREPSISKLDEYPVINRDRLKHHNRLLWTYRHPRIDEYGAAALCYLDDSGLH